MFSSITSLKKKEIECYYLQQQFPFTSQVTVSVCEQNVRARRSRWTAAKFG